MPSRDLPRYTHHKASGQARVRIAGRDIYLGKFNSKESRAEYDRVVAQWLANGRQLRPTAQSAPPTVNMVIASWLTSGKVSEAALVNWKRPLSLLRKMYGATPAKDFGPVALKAYRLQLIEDDIRRSTVNKYTGYIKRIFRHAVSCELIPVEVVTALATVEGLRKGETKLRESRKIRPVDDAVLEQVIAKAPPMLAAMIRLQRLTGMRAGEMVIMRTCDIDRSESAWKYIPTQHKGSHREDGGNRTVFIGPRGQEVLKPYINESTPEAFLFSPARAEGERRAAVHAARKTPMNQGNKPGVRRKAVKRKQPSDRYDTDSYGNALGYLCDRVFPCPLPPDLARNEGESKPDWRKRLGPDACAKVRELIRDWRKTHHFGTHQLRHAKGKEVRREYGLDAVQAVLGHRHAKVSEIYSELEQGRAREAAEKLG